jgi:hypothetical protein
VKKILPLTGNYYANINPIHCFIDDVVLSKTSTTIEEKMKKRWIVVPRLLAAAE